MFGFDAVHWLGRDRQIGHEVDKMDSLLGLEGHDTFE
jgi:hypothetical protein